MSPADITPEPQSANDAFRPWNVLMGNVALRHLTSSGKGKSWQYEARIEELGPDGDWRKIGHVDSKISEGELGDDPPEELTRIFLQHRCVAAIATLPQGLTLTIYGVGNWRMNHSPRTPGTRVVGLENGLPVVRIRAIPSLFRIGDPVKVIEDEESGIEIARFRERRVRRLREETDFPVRMLPARWRAPLCAPPRLFQSFGPPEMFAHPSTVPLIAAVALRQCAVDRQRRAG
jgi:hypothetical protein